MSVRFKKTGTLLSIIVVSVFTFIAPIVSASDGFAATFEVDSDGDGIHDRVDSCPNEPGTVSNHGCAEDSHKAFSVLGWIAVTAGIVALLAGIGIYAVRTGGFGLTTLLKVIVHQASWTAIVSGFLTSFCGL